MIDQYYFDTYGESSVSTQVSELWGKSKNKILIAFLESMLKVSCKQ